MDTTKDPLIITAAVVLFIMLLLFAVVLTFIIRAQRQFYANSSKTVLSRLEILETERTRIARDLHDELSPMLSRVFMYVDVCSNRYGPAVSDFLLPPKDILSHLIERVAEIIKNLEDERIIKNGLQQSILTILEQYRHLQQLQSTFYYKVKSPLSRAATIGLYLILLELIQNTLKHAHASAIEVQIWQWRSFLFFNYKDNGSGTCFSGNPDGTGLKSLQQRIELLGGTPEANTQPGNGFQFHIPLKPHKDGSC
ncbi:sensor histidine kinase [Niabella drilacis]|uniref:histidine kinase n=1 Tax=Niabella drilacis (strain DSM 25811 / CCM 8410 / CCUG 62505 / LMG 26954 / E90) TaxID=1285928 RepID=A0A1G6PH18_NIADE|nr:ATP-binding protein [Niabella drilacis]SDC79359.1 Histidine kinase [Niabella drilacis]